MRRGKYFHTGVLSLAFLFALLSSWAPAQVNVPQYPALNDCLAIDNAYYTTKKKAYEQLRQCMKGSPRYGAARTCSGSVTKVAWVQCSELTYALCKLDQDQIADGKLCRSRVKSEGELGRRMRTYEDVLKSANELYSTAQNTYESLTDPDKLIKNALGDKYNALLQGDLNGFLNGGSDKKDRFYSAAYEYAYNFSNMGLSATPNPFIASIQGEVLNMISQQFSNTMGKFNTVTNEILAFDFPRDAAGLRAARRAAFLRAAANDDSVSKANRDYHDKFNDWADRQSDEDDDSEAPGSGGGVRAPMIVLPGATPQPRRSSGTVITPRRQPAGVILAGSAAGLEPIDSLTYDARTRQFLVNGRHAFFSALTPGEVRELVTAIARDDRIVVSDGMPLYVEGGLPESGAVARNLLLADKFLGGLIFSDLQGARPAALDDQFAPKPKPEGWPHFTAATFRLGSFAFALQGERIVLESYRLNIALTPILDANGPRGEVYTTDELAGNQALVPRAYRENTRHLAAHYRRYLAGRCPAVVEYGAAAALLRSAKAGGVDLNGLVAGLGGDDA